MMRIWIVSFLCVVWSGQLRAAPLWFVLESVNQSNVEDTVLDDPRVAGYSIRVTWDQLEPADGKYDWSYLDAQVSRATSRDKQYMIRVIAGDDTPTHAYGQPWVEGIPRPDDPQMELAYRDLQQALAARYWRRLSTLCRARLRF